MRWGWWRKPRAAIRSRAIASFKKRTELGTPCNQVLGDGVIHLMLRMHGYRTVTSWYRPVADVGVSFPITRSNLP